MTVRAPVQEGLTRGGGVFSVSISTMGFIVGHRACVPQSSTHTPSSEAALDAGKCVLGLDGGRDPARAQLSWPRGGPTYHWGIRRTPRPLLFVTLSNLSPSLLQRTCQQDPHVLQKHPFYISPGGVVQRAPKGRGTQHMALEGGGGEL